MRHDEPMPVITLARRSFLLGLATLPSLGTSDDALALPHPASELIGTLRHHLTRPEDTLLDLAVQNDLGILALSAANPGVDAWVPGADRLITLPTRHVLPDGPRDGMIINKAELRLYYFQKGGPVITHAIGVGREGFDTPVGETRIVRKAKDPVWRPTESTRRDRPELPAAVPPGPENPLGNRALYLGWPTYLIHGTNKPYGVGRLVSRGCIRMYPASVERLFEQVPVGTRVTVVEQPIKLGWDGGELHLQAYPDTAQLEELEETYGFMPKPGEVAPTVLERIRARAGGSVDRVDWKVVEAELVARRGIPVQITGAKAPVAELPTPHAASARAELPTAPVGLY